MDLGVRGNVGARFEVRLVKGPSGSSGGTWGLLRVRLWKEEAEVACR